MASSSSEVSFAVGTCGHSVTFSDLSWLGLERNCSECGKSGAFLRGSKNFLVYELQQHLARPRTPEEKADYSNVLLQNVQDTEAELKELKKEFERLKMVEQMKREQGEEEQQEATEERNRRHDARFWEDDPTGRTVEQILEEDLRARQQRRQREERGRQAGEEEPWRQAAMRAYNEAVQMREREGIQEVDEARMRREREGLFDRWRGDAQEEENERPRPVQVEAPQVGNNVFNHNHFFAQPPLPPIGQPAPGTYQLPVVFTPPDGGRQRQIEQPFFGGPPRR